jgi:hypothetical protein
MALPGYGFHAVSLMRTFFKSTESYLACNVAGEVSQIEGMFGPMRVAGLQQGVKILDLGRYPRLSSPILRPVAIVAALGIRGLDAIRGRASSDRIEVGEEDPVSAFDTRFDRLFDAAVAATSCIPEKTSAFLRWRYGPGTPRPVRLLTARAADGRLHGYAVLRTTVGADGFILDLMTEPGRRDVARALLVETIRRFWRDRAFIARYRFLPSPVSPARSDLARLGFRFPGASRGVLPGARPERQLELSVKLAGPASQAAAVAPEHWSYNLGDGEASFWVP